jgi:hypothetical protein
MYLHTNCNLISPFAYAVTSDIKNALQLNYVFKTVGKIVTLGPNWHITNLQQ